MHGRFNVTQKRIAPYYLFSYNVEKNYLFFFLFYIYFAYINSYHEKHYVKIKTHRV